jgi:hypothetical protein
VEDLVIFHKINWQRLDSGEPGLCTHSSNRAVKVCVRYSYIPLATSVSRTHAPERVYIYAASEDTGCKWMLGMLHRIEVHFIWAASIFMRRVTQRVTTLKIGTTHTLIANWFFSRQTFVKMTPDCRNIPRRQLLFTCIFSGKTVGALLCVNI